MATTRDAVIRLYDARLTEIFFDTWDELPEQFSQVFDVKNSDKRQEEDYHLAGTGMWRKSDEGEPTRYHNVTEGKTVTYIHDKFDDGVMITREAIDDDLYDALKDATKILSEGGRATIESIAADVLNDSFSVNGYDGKPLFANDHPLPKGDELDNLASGALGDDTLKQALVLGRSHINNQGIKMMTKYDQLIVPPDLEWTALELMQSSLKIGTADNDINTIKGRLKVVVLDYLTSKTAWFIQDKSRSRMKFYWRVKPEFTRKTDFDSDIQRWRGYARCSVGYSAPQAIVGSTGL